MRWLPPAWVVFLRFWKRKKEGKIKSFMTRAQKIFGNLTLFEVQNKKIAILRSKIERSPHLISYSLRMVIISESKFSIHDTELEHKEENVRFPFQKTLYIKFQSDINIHKRSLLLCKIKLCFCWIVVCYACRVDTEREIFLSRYFVRNVASLWKYL